MALKTAPSSKSSVRETVRHIRDSWSPSEREVRKKEGRRRRQELFSMLSYPGADIEIWAVGAPMSIDVPRSMPR